MTTVPPRAPWHASVRGCLVYTGERAGRRAPLGYGQTVRMIPTTAKAIIATTELDRENPNDLPEIRSPLYWSPNMKATPNKTAQMIAGPISVTPRPS